MRRMTSTIANGCGHGASMRNAYAGAIMLVDKHSRTDKLIGSKRLELHTYYNLATGDEET